MLWNLIPAMPLDGGRVARAALSGALGRGRATRLLCWVGVALGGAMALVGVWGAVTKQLNLTLILTGAYLIYAALDARREGTLMALSNLTGHERGLSQDGVLSVRWVGASADIPIHKLPPRFSARHYHFVAALQPGSADVVGVFTQAQLLEALLEDQRQSVGTLAKKHGGLKTESLRNMNVKRLM